MREMFLYFIFFLLFGAASCQAVSKDTIETKNLCIDKKVELLKERAIYLEVLAQFVDTFNILKLHKENFGDTNYTKTKIDNAIFFNKDSSKCILIVNEKDVDTIYAFGAARIIEGIKIQRKWNFRVSFNYTFDKEFFKMYEENSFENISKLSRVSVISEENIYGTGCELSEGYWFKN